MIRLLSPAQGRIAIGSVVIAGQKVEVTINDEWARFFEAIASNVTAGAQQITMLQGAISSGMTSDSDQGDNLTPGPQGLKGETGPAGPPIGFLVSDPESPDLIPGPQGAPGAQGQPGPALFVLQENDHNDMYWPILAP